jgi:hypothetical protein
MAWENVIVGYKLKKFTGKDIIPPDAKFVEREKGSTYICGSYYPYEYFIYQVPVYQKKNIKRK